MSEEATKEKFCVIAAKISKFCEERIERICQKREITKYKMLQMMCDCIVRYMDDQHNLTPEMERAMFTFEHMQGWKDALNWADPDIEKSIGAALYVLQDPDGKQKGVRCTWVNSPYFGDCFQTENIQEILEQVVFYLLPDRYVRLRWLCQEMECSSILELFDLLIDAQTIEQLNKPIRDEFEDCARYDFGQHYEYGQRTKRKHHVDPDSLALQQMRIHFEPDDVPELYETQSAQSGQSAQSEQGEKVTGKDVEDAMGGRPFGTEA